MKFQKANIYSQKYLENKFEKVFKLLLRKFADSSAEQGVHVLHDMRILPLLEKATKWWCLFLFAYANRMSRVQKRPSLRVSIAITTNDATLDYIRCGS